MPSPSGPRATRRKLTPIDLELFRHALLSIADEMGIVLRRTSFSSNIKERRDYSCAVYDRDAQTLAMGDHMPVHLGAMPMSVRYALEDFQLSHGDVGGMTPGSMWLAREIYQEGLRIPPIRLVTGGETDQALLRLITANVR